MKIRQFPESNYKGIFTKGKTIRIPLDPSKKITELKYPEFYDVGLNTKCFGNCVKYCYTSAMANGKNFDNIVEKIQLFFGHKDLNKRCFQVAIGASGEPTIHPQFINALKTFSNLGILPNYTTNGMHLSKDIIEATKEYSGGVAVTLHRHLEYHWRKAIDLLLKNKIKTNFHIIVSDAESVEFLSCIYKEYNKNIDYFVLLPYMNTGFAAHNPKQIDYSMLEKFMDQNFNEGKIAFGSNFYDWILKTENKYKTSLYPPEIFSKYIVLSDPIKVYDNSFNCRERNYDKNGVQLSAEL